MPDIFDLDKIKRLIVDQKLSAAIIIDTNIIINEPDFSHWKTSLAKPLYIFPCMLQSELEHLKNKPDSKEEARLATQNISRLCREGNILDGIYKDGIGWFISTPSPERELMEPELERLDALVRVFGQMDTKLIILAREFTRTLPSTPLIFATRDKSLFNAIQFIGINAYLFQGFPMTGLEKLAGGKSPDSTKWDRVLREIQSEAEKKLVQVELTLLSKSNAPKWVQMMEEADPDVQVIVAEGTGVIHTLTDIVFSWALPYTPWDFPSMNNAEPGELDSSGDNGPAAQKPGKWSLGMTNLDFGGLEHNILPGLYKALVKKINNCASPMAYIEDMPTVQDPVSVIRQFFLFEYVFQERSTSELPRESLEEFEKKLKDEDNLYNWAYFWLRDREVAKQDADISFSEFLHAMRSCWSIGETIEIELMDNPAELTNLKGEAEE